VRRADIEDLYPLSPQQQGMLFGTLLAGAPGLYVEQESHALPPGLDRSAFRQAWERVLARHGALRTAFVWRDQEQPVQVVLRRVELPLEERDWRGCPPADLSARLDAFLAEDRHRGFDLARAPLMRLTLLRTDSGHQLVWTLHHIVMDGWCRPLLLRELTALYAWLCGGAEPELDAPRPYRDYVGWLRRQDLAAAEAFWSSTLAGFTRPTRLGRPEPAVAAPAAPQGSVERRLGAAETAALQGLARRGRLTLSTALHGVWALLLSRYSGERDVVFGTTVSGRPPELAGAESMIGLFIQTLPFRVVVAPDAPLLPWLETVQRRHLELRHFEHCSAGQVHQWSQVPASSPLYESLLVFENYPSGAPRDAGRGADAGARFAGAHTAHALTILAAEAGDLLIRLVHDRRRIDDGSAGRILAHLTGLLGALAADPHQPLSALLARVPADEVPRVRGVAGAGAPATRPYAAPRTETERVLSRLWGEVLGLERIGVHDNFLELGGHSLVATQLMARLRDTFGLDLPLRVLFESATLAELAEVVEDTLLREIEALPESEAERRLSEAGPG
jgi:acyl carrier protein